MTSVRSQADDELLDCEFGRVGCVAVQDVTVHHADVHHEVE